MGHDRQQPGLDVIGLGELLERMAAQSEQAIAQDGD